MRTVLILALLLPAPAALAAQSLVATPYPSASLGAAPLNPPSAGTGAMTQGLTPTPFPQATGASQGNAPDARMGGPQQRVPSTYRRNYGVDQH